MLLLDPIDLKSVRLRNRIIMPAMHLPQPGGRVPNETLTAFYEARAIGGAGLIMIGGCGVDMAGSGAFMLGIDDDSAEHAYRKLATAVKRHGAAAGIQLFHAGRYTRSSDSGSPPVAPSPIRSRLTGETPRELTQDEIAEIVARFAAAAARVKSWGFDVVEIIGSAGYLVSQFLSPLTNRRTDAYGGPLEARARFLTDLIRAVRNAVGPGVPIMLRLSGNDFVEGGLGIAEASAVAVIAAEAGVDAFNVTGGWHETRVPQISGFVPPAAFAYLARAIRDAVRSSEALVSASNRINNAEIAETLLRDGAADLVSMGRALIADADLPRKIVSGETIIPCIACNQSCFDRIFDHESVSCLVNPRSGRETEAAAKAPERKKRIVIVGAGPAGCTAAITAAERGHGVVLLGCGKIGGKTSLTARSYGKSEWARLGRYHEARIWELRIDVRFGPSVTAEDVASLRPDCVIVATGATPIVPPIPGVDLPQVCTAETALASPPAGQSVVVIGGGAVGCEVALELALEGTASPELIYFLLVSSAESADTLRSLAFRGSRTVTVVEMLPRIGEGIGRTTRWTYMEELKRRNVRLLSGTRAIAIEPGSVVVESRSGQQRLPADLVVLATGFRPDRSLADQLAGRVPELHVVGDAAEVGDAEAAILSAFKLARSI